ncbi:MAG: SufE family protein [Clostridia bacterium]|nr:SufE family protein [Clostridia bacterium]
MFHKSEIAMKLFSLDNELDRFDFLAMEALKSKFPDAMKTDANRLFECETKTWYYLEFDCRVRLYADSDSLFVKGLCAVLSDTAAKIGRDEAEKKIGFAEECFRRGIIDGKRLRGLSALEDEISAFAKKNFKNFYHNEEK